MELRKLPDPTTPAPPPADRPRPGRARQLDANQVQALIQGYTSGATIYELGRATMRPTTLAGFRHAWDTLERLCDSTVHRARRLDPALLHDSVDGEWSFVETLRHLAFATDSWVRRAILGNPTPWDPLDLPWDEMPDTPGIPHDRNAQPSLDTVLELRCDRMSTVRQVIDGLTDESLDGHTRPVEAPGWPPSRSYPVRECLLCILNEEWEHRLYAERDLAALEARNP